MQLLTQSPKSNNVKFGANGRIVGKTIVENANGRFPVTVSAYNARDCFGRVDRFDFSLPDDKLVGWLNFFDSSIYNAVSLEYLESGLKGLGKKIVQTAIELSCKRGYQGNIGLTADDISDSSLLKFRNNYKSPVGFYYEKCHLRADPEWSPHGTDERIEQELKRTREANIPP